VKHIREAKDQFQAWEKMVKSKLQGGNQKEIVAELLGCVEYSTVYFIFSKIFLIVAPCL